MPDDHHPHTEPPHANEPHTNEPRTGGPTRPESPHDAVFRGVVGRPEHAASLLRTVLPEALSARIDLDRLTQVSGSFVDARMKWRHADVLFTAPVDEREAYVYVLIEHQSRPDPLMAFRLLEYTVRIWRHHLNRHRNATRLPAVLPVVVAHNPNHPDRPWSAPTSLTDVLDLEPGTAEAMAPHLPRLEFLLDDLATVDVEALRGQPLTPEARLTLVVLRNASSDPHLKDDLQTFIEDLAAIVGRSGVNDSGEEGLLGLIMRYVLLVGQAPPEDYEALFTRIGPTAREAYMTSTADQYIQRGLEEGRVEGRVEGRGETLTRLLTQKFGPLPEHHQDRIQHASLDELDTWTDRILTAPTLNDVFR
ncbi:Rpn family recombination-promoting nuclease/putative transposase [Ruania alkalisoli]|uniref:Rpn family recombination-promoting nuclease/putative transposase n=1 Tax=Ruania alkalisoli TaxID=2779775 RepID=A0A7M1SSY4_9MICO|nr:Rpn family recombination-promoting nuclease/putative transposase [Ruania alkalisoli]QOR69723.1 Rpn family recombination-promoting nuclease/putative transposase [Ruania alkalisoli]